MGYAAWVIVLTAAATYCGIFASYLLARPALRNFVLQSNMLALDSQTHPDPDIERFRREAVQDFKDRLKARVPGDSRLNWWGAAVLLLSFVIFSGAVALQLRTDPAFSGEQSCTCPSISNGS